MLPNYLSNCTLNAFGQQFFVSLNSLLKLETDLYPQAYATSEMLQSVSIKYLQACAMRMSFKYSTNFFLLRFLNNLQKDWGVKLASSAT
jgi:hypothetical protein